MSSNHHWLAVGSCLIVFVAAGLIADLVLEQVPHLEDEVAYLFQAQVFAAGKTHVDAPFDAHCFFAPFVLDHQGRRFGKYPPGWPALLSVGVRLGQTWWVNAVGASLTAALVFRLGREMDGPLTGALAALLAATSPFLLILSGSMMSHTWCLVFTTAFLWCYYRSCTSDSGREGWSLAAGALLGGAFAIRPFTAAAVALPAGLHTLWRLVQRGEWRAAWCLGVGFAPVALVVPVFSALWTGDPLLSPYVLFWPYDRLGFGPGTGPVPSGNTVWLGLSGAVASIGHLANHLSGWPAFSLVFVILLFLFRPRQSWHMFLVATALSLIFGYVLYWTSGDVFGPRYAYEVVSALLVLSAAGIVRVGRWAARHGNLRAFVAVLLLFVGVDLFAYLPWQLQRYHGLYGISGRSREILEQADLHHALVIVHDENGWYDYAVAFSMNAPTRDGDVVYASDCSPSNDILVSHYPGRRVYYFDGVKVRPYLSAGMGDPP